MFFCGIKQKFSANETLVFIEENKSFVLSKLLFSIRETVVFLGRNHLLRYSNLSDSGKEYIKNDRY